MRSSLQDRSAASDIVTWMFSKKLFASSIGYTFFGGRD